MTDTIEISSKLGDMFRTLADVADGKISFDDAIKSITDIEQERNKLKSHYQEFKDFVQTLKTNIKQEVKNAKKLNDFKVSHDTKASLTIYDDNGNIKGFMGGKPKEKTSFFTKMKNRFARRLRQDADFIDGKTSFSEYAKQPLKNLHSNMMEDSTGLYRDATSVVQGVKRGFKKTISDLRGTSKNSSTPQPKTPSIEEQYAKLEPKQFAVALGQAYENIAKLQRNGWESDMDKQKVLQDIAPALNEAKRRFPDLMPADKGSFYKDNQLANTEALAFAALGKVQNHFKDDFVRYSAWRHGKNFETSLGDKTLSEEPFHNSARYGSGSNKYEYFKNPLKTGKNVMSNKELEIARQQVAKLKMR